MQLAFNNKNVHRLLCKKLQEARPDLKVNIVRSLRGLSLFRYIK